jgi:nucleotide-binding universal stress UspA family protein/HEAT repeat protein
MFARILVPLDGSPLAEQALPLATGMAQRFRATLHLLRAVVVPAGLDVDFRPLVDALRDEAQRYLDEMAQRLRTSGYTVVTAVIEAEPADAILEYTQQHDITLIVMATHGRTGLGRWVLGSVADKVVRASHRPVLLVRAGAAHVSPDIHRILLPLDGSTLAEQALPLAEALARAFFAEIVVLRVITPVSAPYVYGDALAGYATPYIEGLLEAQRTEAERYVADTVEQLRAAGLRARGEIAGGLPADEILRVAAEHQVDLIVMATHGRSGLGRFALGSVAERIVGASPVPVLVIRPAGQPPAQAWPEGAAAQAALARRAAQGDVGAAAVLLAALREESPRQQLAAAQAAAAVLGQNLARRLLRFVATGTWDGGELPGAPVGSPAQYALARAAEALLTYASDAAEPALVEGLTAGNPAIRRTAARLLGEIPASEEGRRALRRALRDPDAHVVTEVARSLAKLRDTAAISDLAAVLGDAPADARGAITDALIAFGPAVVPALLPLLADEREHVRWHAARVLAALRDERAAQPLANLLNDPSAGVRWLAETGLRRLPQRVAARAVLHALIQHELTDWLRDSAAGLLGRFDGAVRRAVEPVRDALFSSLAREEAPVRAAEALQALEAMQEPPAAEN